MCGIVGWAFDEDLAKQPGLIDAASTRLAHRGPDASGTWRAPDGIATFGHRRLAVLDLSPTGAQPMTSADGRWVITFNGEIYNHRDLRAQLVASGSSPAGGFRGPSDTETLLTAIDAWGVEQTLRSIRGMFAFALWDARSRRLTLARDRFGEKPLYVTRMNRGIAFASELKALQLLPGFDRTIDISSLDSFLRHGYIQAPYSIYRSTGKLLPGTYVTVNESEAFALPRWGDILAPKRRVYWSMADVATQGKSSPFQGSLEEATDELQRILGEAVDQQRDADVPLGAFLSGGIDSTAITALMQTSTTKRVRTFTIGFEESDYDESKYAAQVAEHLGTEHFTTIMSPREALNRIDLLPDIWDEPFADISQLPTLLLSEVTRRNVTVALSGDGGDELFGGYERYTWTESAWSKLRRIPRPVRVSIMSGVRAVAPKTWDHASHLMPERFKAILSGDRLHKIAALLPARDMPELYDKFLSSWKSPAPLLLGDEPAHRDHWSAYPQFGSIAESLMYRDAVDYMPDDVLVKVDRAAMSTSLETRAPLLDPEVAAFAWSLPLEYKRSGSIGKVVLRRLVHKHVPPALVERPKAGFAVPLDTWLRGPMREWAEAFLSENALIAAGLNAAPIRSAWAAHLRGTENHRYFLWNVLTYQAWLDRHAA